MCQSSLGISGLVSRRSRSVVAAAALLCVLSAASAQEAPATAPRPQPDPSAESLQPITPGPDVPLIEQDLPGAPGVPAGGQPTQAPLSQDVPTTQPVAGGYWLRVTGDHVNVRARADTNSLVIAQVDRGAMVQGMGMEFGWHRILPPEGSFSFVAARYVRREADRLGRAAVEAGKLRVRAGSTVRNVDPLESEVIALLENGTPVEIVGEVGDWLMIRPPAGVSAYITDQYVERVGGEGVEQLIAAAPPIVRSVEPGIPTSNPSVAGVGGESAGGSERPAEVYIPDEYRTTWGLRLWDLFREIGSEGSKPPAYQNWSALIGKLEPIAAQREEPGIAGQAARWIQRLQERMGSAPTTLASPTLTAPTALTAPATTPNFVETDVVGDGRVTGSSATPGTVTSSPPPLSSSPALSLPPPVEMAPTSPPAGVSGTSVPAPGGFLAQGVLQPTFALPAGPHGLRYRLRDLRTGKVTGYAEFPLTTGIDPSKAIGKFVGVQGERRFEPSLGVTIIRVNQMTVAD